MMRAAAKAAHSAVSSVVSGITQANSGQSNQEDLRKSLAPAEKPHGVVRFVCISDTHNHHRELSLPSGDVLLHAGDFTRNGTLDEVVDFNTWLGEVGQRFKYVIVIGGNHDLCVDKNYSGKHLKSAPYQNSDSSTTRDLDDDRDEHRDSDDLDSVNGDDSYGNGTGVVAGAGGDGSSSNNGTNYGTKPGDGAALLTNCTLLMDESLEVLGVRLYASSTQPRIGRKYIAFGVDRGDASQTAWSKVPASTDIILAHTPPFGYLDRVFYGKRMGCEALLQACHRVRPRFVVFGHIHGGYGVSQISHAQGQGQGQGQGYENEHAHGNPVGDETTVCINAAVMTPTRAVTGLNAPIVFDVTPSL